MRKSRHAGDGYPARPKRSLTRCIHLCARGVSSLLSVGAAAAGGGKLRALLLLLATAWSLSACSHGIGDACDTALTCSASGTRECDMTQPGGYCTLQGCDQGTCPSEAVCVKFWPKANGAAAEDRLGTNYCMLKCSGSSDCRTSDGYACTSAQNFGAMMESEVLDNPNQKFCAVRSQSMAYDAGSWNISLPDASTPDASDQDAGAQDASN